MLSDSVPAVGQQQPVASDRYRVGLAAVEIEKANMKKMLAVLVAVMLGSSATSGWSQARSPTPAPMDCSTGPVQRTYGGSNWLIYSCPDHRSMVAVSAPGSRAGPFYFMLNPTATGHNLVGEGNGDRTLTDRAHAQLAALSESDISQLIAQTRAVSKK